MPRKKIFSNLDITAIFASQSKLKNGLKHYLQLFITNLE